VVCVTRGVLERKKSDSAFSLNENACALHIDGGSGYVLDGRIYGQSRLQRSICGGGVWWCIGTGIMEVGGKVRGEWVGWFGIPDWGSRGGVRTSVCIFDHVQYISVPLFSTSKFKFRN